MSKPSITNCPNTFFRKVHSFSCWLSIESGGTVVLYLINSLLVCKYVIPHYQVVIAVRSHLFPFRTEKLSSLAPMVLQCGRVGSRLLLSRASDFERFLRLFCFSHWFHRCSQIFPKSLHERYRKSENILSINDLEDCVRKECWNNVEFRWMILIF